MSLTKNPMKPMTIKPRAVLIATLENSAHSNEHLSTLPMIQETTDREVTFHKDKQSQKSKNRQSGLEESLQPCATNAPSLSTQVGKPQRYRLREASVNAKPARKP